MSSTVKETQKPECSQRVRDSYQVAEALISLRKQFSGDALGKEMRDVVYAPRSGLGAGIERKPAEELEALAKKYTEVNKKASEQKEGPNPWDAMERQERRSLWYAHDVTRVAAAVRELWGDMPDEKRAKAEEHLVETLNGMMPAEEILRKLAECGRIPPRFATYPPPQEMTKEQRKEVESEMNALLERLTLDEGPGLHEREEAQERKGEPGDLNGFAENEAGNPDKILKMLDMSSTVGKVPRKEQESIVRHGLVSALEKLNPEDKEKAGAYLGQALEIIVRSIDKEKIGKEFAFLNEYSGAPIGGSHLTGPKDAKDTFKKIRKGA